jgi:hypothetical protein
LTIIVLAGDEDKPVFTTSTLVEKKRHGFKPPAHKLCQQEQVALDLALNTLDLDKGPEIMRVQQAMDHRALVTKKAGY